MDEDEAPKRGRGRPTKYRRAFAEQAKRLCKLGATNAELADFFEVSVRTVDLWIVQHPEFSRALKVGKAVADQRVERALYQRAVGYEHDEDDIRTVGVGKGLSEIVVTRMRKHIPPDPTSIIYWLKNRKSAQWRDLKAVEVSGAGGGPLSMAMLDAKDVNL